MRFGHGWCVLALCVCLAQTSCSRKASRPVVKDKVALSKVTGSVVVDDQPRSGVWVRYYPTGPLAETRQQYLSNFQATSTAKGTFSFQTYEPGDGVPAGEYGVYFSLQDQRRAGAVELLAEEFTNSKKPYKKITVVQGENIDLGQINLKTGKPRKLK